MVAIAWVEKVLIPTYKTGAPEKNPMFLEKRVYQGSSGVVYPHSIIENISDEKTDEEYTAVFLENDYLKIMILPELGGRIQRAYDKIRKRDFVYYNEVIKPALVGLAGPWISGGIEFNWPQHHRPSTFSPVDYTIEENEDGSKTVWVNEIELMFRTKGMAGFTLYPGKAFLEIKGKLFNRTPFPQTFLWWANPAVKVNEHYQSVFPPDVYAVFDHGRRDVSDFPVATGTYYKVNYAPGTDISRYHTIPVPTSYMAIKSKYDFMGCYEHDANAGMLHVANHHYSPGKKQWTWGNGDFGFAWDRNLTDENGPYIELMTGVFTDNQPDFSWLHPNEGKTFEQYFMPYAQIGLIKNATKEAMLNVEFDEQNISLKVYATAVYENASIQLFKNGEVVKKYTTTLSPAEIFNEVCDVASIGKPDYWKVKVLDGNNCELVSYQPEAINEKEIPVAATAAKLPSEIEQMEDLYLNGQHLEQYRHATYNPMDYYEEGLKRSPEDIRCNNAIGLLLLRRGQFEKAEPYFRKAIKTLTKRNPNPYDGEVFYNLGWSLKLQGEITDAYDSFYKATWSDAWQHSSFFALARIDASQKKWNNALELIEKSLIRNYHSPLVRHLKAALLRHTGRLTESLSLIEESIKIDPFNYGCLFEAWLIQQRLKDEQMASGVLKKIIKLMRNAENNYLELSLDYAQAGLHEEAIQVLTILAAEHTTTTPLVYYYLGWFSTQFGNQEASLNYYKQAAAMDPTQCFPNKIEEVLILESALLHNPTDAKANYYLGNLWYDKRQYTEAIECWEKAILFDDSFPTAYRNLSLAYYNKLKQKDKAILYLEKAFSLDTTDARILMELDQLYKITGKVATERLAFLDSYADLIEKRDDLYLEKIILYNNLQQFDRAKELLAARKFHPWEGGEGKVVAEYLSCHLELAKQAIQNNQYQQALELLSAMEHYPENLGEGKLYGTQENDRFYLLGCVYEGMELKEKAVAAFQVATAGISEPAQAIFYNDPQPDKIIYQALAWLKLGEQNRAKKIFESFISFGEKHMQDKVSIDYFAVSLPDMLVFDMDIHLKNTIHCKYLIGLGQLGLGDYALAKQNLHEVLHLDISHQGAIIYLRMFPFFEKINSGQLIV
jgi:tetratricopeptide (TPR) repeat protein